MDKLQKPEQAGYLIVLYNCKQSASALIHHLLTALWKQTNKQKSFSFLLLIHFKYKEVFHRLKDQNFS